jgi:hypothetical protein
LQYCNTLNNQTYRSKHDNPTFIFKNYQLLLPTPTTQCPPNLQRQQRKKNPKETCCGSK